MAKAKTKPAAAPKKSGLILPSQMTADEAKKTGFKPVSLDPRQAIYDKLGDVLDHIDVFKGMVLVATYKRETVGTSGRIIAADKTKTEDEYQGRVGLVLKIGPLAFINTKDIDFGGKAADEGEWVFYTPANGTGTLIRGVHCRLLDDVNIDGVVDDPDVLF
jgi:hypothetical protein